MNNTYYNKNISLTVLSLAIALSTSLSAAQHSERSRIGTQLSSSDETLPHRTMSVIKGVQTMIFSDVSRVDNKKDYEFYKLTSTWSNTKPKENEIIKYNAEQIHKGEEGYVETVANDELRRYMYTPGENFSDPIQLAYSLDSLNDDGSNKFAWGVCTITVLSLATLVQRLESAIKEEEQARESGIRQLNLNQTKLATALSILNCRMGALTNQINELNANPCGWGEWFKSLWR